MTTANPSAAWEWAECPLPATRPPADLVAEIRRTSGRVPEYVSRLGACAWVARAAAAMTSDPFAHVPDGLVELIGLVVSRDNSCRYCYGAQRAFMKMLGYGDTELERIERDLHGADLAPADVVALDWARKISRANPRPTPADRAALADAGFSGPAIAEIAFAAAATVFANRLSTLLALPDERFIGVVGSPLVKPLRPLLAWWFRRRPRSPEPLPDPNPDPCAALVAALDGSPAARVLRRVVDEGFASPVLPRRTKLFLFGVVARAVACARGEGEARAGLAAEGVAAAAVEETLANLGSTALDAREARLVPFARETVRFHQPATIQARFRTVTEGMTPAERVEVAGFLALANAVCRLSILVDRC